MVGHHRGVGGRRSGSGLVRARVEQRAGEASIAVLAVEIRPGVHDTGRGPAPRVVHAEKAHELAPRRRPVAARSAPGLADL